MMPWGAVPERDRAVHEKALWIVSVNFEALQSIVFSDQVMARWRTACNAPTGMRRPVARTIDAHRVLPALSRYEEVRTSSQESSILNG